MLIDQTTLNGTSLVDFNQFIGYFSTYPLIIPNNYQRDYKWAIPQSKGQITALEVFLADFKKGMDTNKIFVLGNIVCVAYNYNKTIYHLADGQQRITTLFIILLEILKRDPEYKEKKITRNLFMDDSKLFLQQSSQIWDVLFKESLLSETDDPLLNISLAQKIINKFIDSCPDFNIETWRNYLLTSIKFNLQWVPLECEEEYFVDVNTKGVVLGTVDNLKLELLKLIPRDLGESLWEQFTLGINTFRENVLSSKLIKLEESILTHSLYLSGIVKELRHVSIQTILSCKNLDVEHLLTTGILYLKFLNSSNSAYFKALRYLKNINMIVMYYKLLLLGFSEENAFKRVIKHLYSVRITCTGDVAKTSTEITNEIPLKISLEDSRFQYGSGKINLKFLLFCIEAYLREGSWIDNILFLLQNSKDVTLEHIQSKQFGGSDCLGNITLLSRMDNSKLNNLQEKLIVYRNSNFLITRSFDINFRPNSDLVRRVCSQYLPGLTSQELDVFNEEATIRRFNSINDLMNIILKEHD